MVKIKYACNRDWQSMSKSTESTRFCDGCNKDIKDFTLNKSINHGSSCGHFSLSQISEVKKQFIFPRLGLYTVSILTVLGVSAIKNPIHAQETITKIQTQNDSVNHVIISGLVKDKEYDQPLPFATIEARTKDSLITKTQTDYDGKFMLQLDTSKISVSDITITFSSPGFIGDTLKTLDIPKDLLNRKVVFDLETAIDTIKVEGYEDIERGITGIFEIVPEEQIKVKKK